MPLFHIHGLMAGILAPLSAGGAVFCTPGFNALQVLRLDGGGEADLVHGRAHHAPGDPVAGGRQPRHHRAPSAAFRALLVLVLPPQVIAELEATFGAPVIESYGMTEASHQMASNPLDGARKPGVGRHRGRARDRHHG